MRGVLGILASWALLALVPVVAGGAVHADDPKGDVHPGLEALENDLAAADILAFQVGPDDPTHLWFAIWLEKLPQPDSFPQRASYQIGGTLNDMAIRGRATWSDGTWSYFLNANGGEQTIGVQAEGFVDEEARRVDVGVPRFHLLDPAAGAGMTDLFANARVGKDVVVASSCTWQACDEASTDLTFQFGNDTGTGLTFTLGEREVRAGRTVQWSGIGTLTGPDTTFASNDPMEIDLAVRAPNSWSARVEPSRVSVQAGDAVTFDVIVEVPANATYVPALAIVASQPGRSNAALLPVAFRPDDPSVLAPENTASAPLEPQPAPGPTAIAITLLAACWLMLMRRRRFP